MSQANVDRLQEVRTDVRAKRLLAARIEYRGSVGKIDCVVRNVSASGARIDLPDCLSLPTEFQVVIPIKAFNRKVRLAWRSRDAVGVEFIAA